MEVFASKREKDASDMLAIFPRIRSLIADASEGKQLGHNDWTRNSRKPRRPRLSAAGRDKIHAW
jgi:hypothetical protein